ncbi:MAG: arginine--tRNA ligase [Chloroflexota bacterium]
MFQKYEEQAAALINDVLEELGYESRPLHMRPIPFSGSWGIASSASFQIANEVVSKELEEELAGLSKKDAKKRQNAVIRERSLEIADSIAAKLEERAKSNGSATTIDHVESANGYVNLFFRTDEVANEVVCAAIDRAADFGKGTPRTDKVMVEFSQPNTHKAFHVGHARNASLGNALANITEFAGFETLRANYYGDIGLHVIKTLWCYLNFHKDERVPPERRGRWLGEIYTESDQRLNYRKEVLGLLHELSEEDALFVEKIDAIMRELYQKEGVSGEDVAYLLGQIANQREIKPEQLFDDDSIAKLWPYIGEQLKEEIAYVEEHGPQKAPPPVSRTANVKHPPPVVTIENTTERLKRWERLGQHTDWWPHVPEWEAQVKELFQVWESKEDWFIELWRETRQWSLDDFARIYDEMGIHFDVDFFESEVEEEGREMVKELVERDIAEISEGLTVVKIDEKLGLEKETYRTMPILRSDGTTLYSTKDLALTRRKFEEYGVDRAIWVVDARQSLYFEQIFKIMELWGFEQAEKCFHLGYEFVTLPEGAMSSRSGNVVLYEDVATALKNRAREIIEEKNPEGRLTNEQKQEIAHDVGIGSLIYSMLARDNNTVISFDLEEALSFQGHAAPYIQYAHARACRILERVDSLPEGPVDFVELQPEEIDLIEKIGVFPTEVVKAAAEYRPLIIADYVYELAQAFNDFYADFDARPILNAEEPARSMRISLVAAARQTLENGLRLLGVPAPEVM